MVSRLRAERNQLLRDNEVLAQERGSAIAQAEAAQRGASRAAPEERKSALRSLNEALETALGQCEEAIAAMSASTLHARGRAAKRPEAALSREALAMDATAKAQTQRDELLSELEASRRIIEQLSDEVDSLKKAAAVRVDPAAPRSPPARGVLPNVRPDESDDSDESVRAKSEKGSGRSSAVSDGDDGDGGSGSDLAKPTTARNGGRRSTRSPRTTRIWLPSCSSSTGLTPSSI